VLLSKLLNGGRWKTLKIILASLEGGLSAKMHAQDLFIRNGARRGGGGGGGWGGGGGGGGVGASWSEEIEDFQGSILEKGGECRGKKGQLERATKEAKDAFALICGSEKKRWTTGCS